MHPWMLEQMASEHRRDLLAQAARPRPVRLSSRWSWNLVGRRQSQLAARSLAAAPPAERVRPTSSSPARAGACSPVGGAPAA
jgi:hypothetical protein